MVPRVKFRPAQNVAYRSHEVSNFLMVVFGDFCSKKTNAYTDVDKILCVKHKP